MIGSYVFIFIIAYIQNISFSMVSRARNRNHMGYHMIASIFSNGVWFLTFQHLVRNNMNWELFIPYTMGTVLGSLTGAKVSMFVEKFLGAKT